MTQPLHRRDFLETCAVTGGALLACGLAARPLHAAEEAGWPTLPPVKIHVVYVGLGGAWPKPDFDAKAEVAKFQKHLDGVKQRLGDVEFVGGELIPNQDAAAAALLPKLAGADGLLIMHLAFGSGTPAVEVGRLRPADGDLLAALQRSRLDVRAAVAKGGQAGDALRFQQLRGSGEGSGTAARAGPHAANADPLRRRAARHASRPIRKKCQGQVGPRVDLDQRARGGCGPRGSKP